VLKEFREFINRGNVIDLAVAVVLGAAFGAVVTSFVDDILMQIIAAIGGQPDFSGLVIDAGDGEIRYGAFLTAVISFVLIGFGVFLVVKAINEMKRRMSKEQIAEEAVEVPSPEIALLAEIRDELRAQRSA
jgi:large conductance mechanosensitive channel